MKSVLFLRTVVLSAGLLALAPSFAFAKAGGTTVGDGGHGVVCKIPGSSDTVELLDTYEARSYLHFGMFDTPITWETGSVRDMIESLSTRFHLTVGSDVLPETFTRALLLSGTVVFEPTLGPTQDVGFLPGDIPKNCSVQQIGVSTTRSGYGYVSANQELWSKMGQQQQALFFVHEALHDDGFDTVVVRQLMTYIMASDMYQVQNRSVAMKIINSHTLVPWSEFKN